MDKALASHTGSRGPNPDQTKEDFFCLEKIKCVLQYPRVPHHTHTHSLYLSLFSIGLLLHELGVNLLQGRQKEEVTWKNHISAICGGETQK